MRDRSLGAAMALVALMAFFLLYTLILGAVRIFFGLLIWALVGAVALKSLFAIHTLEDHVRPVIQSLQSGDMETARNKVQMVVSRDTSKLDEGHLASCALETVAENAVDSVFSPLLFLGMAGIPGVVLYRVSNTLDAMVGYLSPKHKDVGWFSAKLDDLLNFVAARLSIPFILLGLAAMGREWREALRVAKRDHSKTSSPNKGWPMAAFAGGLGVRLEKIGYYTFGDGPLPSPRSIEDAVLLMKGSSLLFFVLFALPLFLIIGINVQILLENLLMQGL